MKIRISDSTDSGFVQETIANIKVQIPGVQGPPGPSDHGLLTGLGDDDHTQYLNNTRGDARYYTQSQITSLLLGKEDVGTAADLISDHESALDPHPQYMTESESDSRYYTQSQIDTLLGDKLDALEISNYVPYNGATGNLDLGSNSLNAWVGDFASSVLSGNLRLNNGSAQFGYIYLDNNYYRFLDASENAAVLDASFLSLRNQSNSSESGSMSVDGEGFYFLSPSGTAPDLYYKQSIMYDPANDAYGSLYLLDDEFSFLNTFGDPATISVGSVSATSCNISSVLNSLSGAFGTSFSPSAQLHVDAGNATASYLKFTAGTTTNRLSTDGFDIGISSTGTAELRQRENLSLEIYTGNVLRAQWTGAGNLFLDGSVQARGGAGSAAVPFWGFTSSSDCGMYRATGSTVGLSTSGVSRMFITSTGLIGFGTSSPSVLMHGISTSSNGQARFGYNTTAYYNIRALSTGEIYHNAVGSVPRHTWQLNGSSPLSLEGETLFLTGSSSPYFSISGPDSGGWVTADGMYSFEFGMYSTNGDETIASYNYDNGEYYYFNRNLSGTESFINCFSDFYMHSGATIGNTTRHASAFFEVQSTTKGFLPPKMTTAQKNAISSPAVGLVVFDTTLNKLCVRGASAWETVTSV